MTHQNLCEKGTKPMEKVLDQSVMPVRRKTPKTTKNVTFLVVLGIFLLVGMSDWANSSSIGLVPLSRLI